MRRYVVVNFNVFGSHYYPGAEGTYEYLKYPHYHYFDVKVIIEVKHNDREIEFFAFRDFVRAKFHMLGEWKDGFVDFGTQSCEDLAEGLIKEILSEYPNRSVCVYVSEDGVNGAEVCSE